MKGNKNFMQHHFDGPTSLLQFGSNFLYFSGVLVGQGKFFELNAKLSINYLLLI